MSALLAVPAPSARPISLADLLAVASLQCRTDRKYLLPLTDLALLDAVARPGSAEQPLRVLTIGGRTAHGYASRYLDTPGRESYLLAAHGRGNRYKVRTRTYLDSGERFLEVKTRGQRGETVKDRLALTSPSVTESARGSGAPTDPGRFAPSTIALRTGHALDGPLTPALDVAYARTTYLLPASGSRVTVDTDLVWSLPTTTPRPGRATLTEAQHASGIPARLELQGYAIVETKTTGRPCALDRLLWRSGHRPLRLSKFACGLALIHGEELPSNRWHRTLQRLRSGVQAHPAHADVAAAR